MVELLDRQPPCDVEAEAAALGCTLLDGKVHDLRAEDFYDPVHRQIYRAMQALSREGTPIDIKLLTGPLRHARAAFNIRFNDRHTSDSLTSWLRTRFSEYGGEYDLKIQVTGEAFLTPPGRLSQIIAEAVKARLGAEPDLSTTGGTSDARFIRDNAPVAEFGLIGQTMHKVDERIAVSDLEALTDIYGDILAKFFAA